MSAATNQGIRARKPNIDGAGARRFNARVTSVIENLLGPVSAASECGDDISYDPAYQELEKLLAGKPETQFSPGEPPNWGEIRDRSVDLLARSKHLRVVVMLCAALARVEGFAGFRDGIDLLKQLIEKYWPALYPRLDPEDNNDPTERVNIIATLCAPLGVSGDQLRFIEALRACPLCSSTQFGRYSYQDILDSRTGVKTPNKPAPSSGNIEGAFASTDPAALQATAAAIAETLALVKALDGLIDSLVGTGKAKDFGPLTGTLVEIQKTLAPYLTAGAGEAAPAEGEAPAGEQAPAKSRGAISGTVESRPQVIQALQMICDYYARFEPSSPIPLLLVRAKRLVEQDFLGVVAELSPENLEKIRAIMGVKKEE